MKDRCKELRAEALNSGIDSAESLSWRIHSRSCLNCRTELYLLETLEQQTAGGRYHLDRNEVAELLQAVRNQHAPYAPFAAAWTWALRLACVCLFFLVLAEFYRDDPEAAMDAEPTPLAPADNQAGAAAGAPAAKETPTDILSWPGELPGNRLDQELHQLRRRIDSRRNGLLQLIEQDLDERNREDAGDNTARSMSVLV